MPLLAFFLGSSLGSIVFRVFSLLGIGVMAYAGFDILIDEVVDLFLAQAADLPADSKKMLGYLNFDKAMSMIFSAYSIRYTLLTAKKFLGIRS
jgi:hypothetical protein